MLNLSFWLLATATLLASMFPVRLPSLGTADHSVRVTVSDLFIFTSILVVSPEAATVLTSFDCIVANRGTKRISRTLTNLFLTAPITFVAGKTFYVLQNSQAPLKNELDFSLTWFLLSFTVMVFVYFALSSGLISLVASAALKKPWRQVWSGDFLWSSVVNLTGAISSASIFLGVTRSGYYALAVFIPVVLIMYYSYRVNSQRIEGLRESQDFLQSTVNSLTSSVAILDGNGIILSLNDAWRHRSGVPLVGEAHPLGSNYLRGCGALAGGWGIAGRALVNAVQGVIEGQQEECHFEYTGEDAPGQRCFTVSVTRFEQRQSVRVVVAHEEITELRRAEQKVIRMAYYDELTGLPNRAFAEEYLGHITETGLGDKKKAALLALDLDDYGKISTTFGYARGQELLNRFGRQLGELFGQGDCSLQGYIPEQFFRLVASRELVARRGEDSFLLVVSDLDCAEDVAEFAARIQKRIAEPFYLNGQAVFLNASIGIALFPDDGEDAETLLQQADTAVNQARLGGKNNLQYYSRRFAATSAEKVNIESRLRGALDREELFLLYQPQIKVTSGRPIGVEALVRLNDDPAAPLMPSKFIPIAEETGLVVSMTQWIMKQACLQAKRWSSSESAGIQVAVNISARHLQQEGLVELVETTLEETGLSPDLLELELTESILLEDIERTKRILARLRDIGVGIALDDFGSGYSSLSYLSMLPITCLKIDRSFLSNIWNNQDIVRAIIAVANGLELRVIAEGVETESELKLLSRLGCSEVQGFYFSPPVKPEQFEEDWLVQQATKVGQHKVRRCG